MRIKKDDYGMSPHVSASLLARLREIDCHYSLRAYDHSTISRARDLLMPMTGSNSVISSARIATATTGKSPSNDQGQRRTMAGFYAAARRI